MRGGCFPRLWGKKEKTTPGYPVVLEDIQVTILGMKCQTELNGQRASVLEDFTSRGKVKVRLNGNKNVIVVSGQHIFCDDGSQWCSEKHARNLSKEQGLSTDSKANVCSVHPGGKIKMKEHTKEVLNALPETLDEEDLPGNSVTDFIFIQNGTHTYHDQSHVNLLGRRNVCVRTCC